MWPKFVQLVYVALAYPIKLIFVADPLNVHGAKRHECLFFLWINLSHQADMSLSVLSPPWVGLALTSSASHDCAAGFCVY